MVGCMFLSGPGSVVLFRGEFRFFDCALTPGAIAGKAPLAEWRRLVSYYGAGPQWSSLELVNNMAPAGFRGASAMEAMAAWAGAWGASVAPVAGAVLEAAQGRARFHIPGVVDVLILGLGACLGGVTCTLYRTLRRGV